MKDINIRKKWTWLLIAGALAAAGWLFIRFTSTSGQERIAGRDVVDNAARSSIDTDSRPLAVGHRGIVRATQKVEPQPSRPTPSEKMHPAMKNALDNDPDLAQYHWLAQKVLPTEEHRRMRWEMLSDLEMIQKAKMDLIASSESAFSKEGEARRMLDVEFLADALTWADNPEIESVSEAIEDVLFSENISVETPDDLAQSLAGDKMELYTQVLHTSPDRAAIIAEHASGREVEALLKYSKTWYDREMLAMKADELP